MTTDFAQPGVSVSLGGAADITPIDQPAPLRWRTFKLPSTDPDVAAYGADGVIGWELRIDDLRGGYMQVGDFARGANQYDGDYRTVASSTLDHRWRRHLLLPTLNTNYRPTGSAASVSGKASFWCELGNGVYSDFTLLWNDGTSTFNLGETSGSNPAVSASALTTGAGADILTPTCCHSIRQAGATAGHRILVGQQGAAPYIYQAYPATTPDNTMHANLSTCWGMIESPINASTPGTATNLFYANSGIWSLPITSSDTSAPTQILSGIPNGGFAIGAEKLAKGNYDLRCFWAFPLVNKTTSVLTDNTPVKIVHTSEEGSDLIDVPMSGNGLGWCYTALFWRKQLVWRDGAHVTVYDGESRRDLRILDGRTADSDHKYQVMDLGVIEDHLVAMIAKIDITTGEASGAVGDTTAWLEAYIPELDSWMPVTGNLTLNGYTYTAGRQRNPRVMSARLHSTASRLPVSSLSGFVQINMASRNFNRFFVSARDNPFTLYRQTGSSQNVAQEYATTGTVTLPYMELPQLEGRWKKADQVIFLGDVDAGGTGAKVEVAINGVTAGTFNQGITDGARVAQLSATGDDGLWMQLQVAITLTQGSSTTKTPNGLPVMIRGRAYLTDPQTQNDGLPRGI